MTLQRRNQMLGTRDFTAERADYCHSALLRVATAAEPLQLLPTPPVVP